MRVLVARRWHNPREGSGWERSADGATRSVEDGQAAQSAQKAVCWGGITPSRSLPRRMSVSCRKASGSRGKPWFGGRGVKAISRQSGRASRGETDPPHTSRFARSRLLLFLLLDVHAHNTPESHSILLPHRRLPLRRNSAPLRRCGGCKVQVVPRCL